MFRQTRYYTKRPAMMLGCIVILLCGFPGNGQTRLFNSSVFCDGEWLKYKVKWKFIRLGTIEIRQDRIEDAGEHVYRVTMRAKSARLGGQNLWGRYRSIQGKHQIAFRINRPLGKAMGLTVPLIALSTVYLGYHHAMDPLAGIIWGYVSYRWLHSHCNRRIFKTVRHQDRRRAVFS